MTWLGLGGLALLLIAFLLTCFALLKAASDADDELDIF